MARIRQNGGFVGKINNTTTSGASGIFGPNELQYRRLGGLWPNVTATAAAQIPDEYFEYTTLLLPGNGTIGAQNNTFLDGSTNNFTITRNGSTTQGTFSPFSQTGWGNYFDGSGDYLTWSPGSSVAFGTGDFTIEFWIYLQNDDSTAVILLDARNASQTTNWRLARDASTNKINFNNGSTALLSNDVLLKNTGWRHIAVTRSGTNLQIFLDGVQTGTSTDNTNYNVSPTISYIGCIYTLSGFLLGYISNLRIIKGTALYTANFTPSTSPLTAITNTSLLTCQSNRFIDNSSNNFTITKNGDTRVVAFSPFNPSESWSAATYGGSGYFDGSGDYLSVADNTAWDFGSGDFTVECLYYPTTSNAQQVMVAQWSGVTGGTGLSWVLFTSNDANRYLRFATSINGSSVSFDLVSTTSLVLNAWNHLAVVRNGNTFQLYLNGTAATGGSTTSAITLYNATNSLTIGATSSGGQLVTGYLSNARIVKGTAVYTGNFTPPTAPLTTAGSTSAAAYPSTTNVNTSFASSATSLLLNFTNAGIYDATSKNDLETVGNAQISTAISAKWGSGSMSFDGTGDYLLSPAPPGSLLDLKTGDYTIESWIYYPSATAAFQTICGVYRFGDVNVVQYYFGVSSTNKLTFGIYASTTTFQTVTSSGNVPTSNWTHVAVTKSGTTLRLFINGTIDGTATITIGDLMTLTAATQFSAGALRDGSGNPYSYLNGYLQDLRITKGYARYTANFTPPTAAFPTL